MLQTVFIRENREKVIAALAKRNIDATPLVDEVIALDEKRRHTQVELDTILSESNKLSKDIGELMKAEGVTLAGEPESYDYGKFAWITDPEGNKIELWEPNDRAFL